jgi:hypothetical protein
MMFTQTSAAVTDELPPRVVAAGQIAASLSSVLLWSDYDKKKALYRVTIADIQKIFRLVGSNYVSWSK